MVNTEEPADDEVRGYIYLEMSIREIQEGMRVLEMGIGITWDCFPKAPNPETTNLPGLFSNLIFRACQG